MLISHYFNTPQVSKGNILYISYTQVGMLPLYQFYLGRYCAFILVIPTQVWSFILVIPRYVWYLYISHSQEGMGLNICHTQVGMVPLYQSYLDRYRNDPALIERSKNDIKIARRRRRRGTGNKFLNGNNTFLVQKALSVTSWLDYLSILAIENLPNVTQICQNRFKSKTNTK